MKTVSVKTIRANTYRLCVNPVFRRWMDTGALICSATILLLVLQKPAISVLNRCLIYTSNWPDSLSYAFALFASVAVSSCLMRMGGLQYKSRIGILFRYPPIWVVGILGTLFFCAVVFYFGLNSQQAWVHSLGTDAIPLLCITAFGGLSLLLYCKLSSILRASFPSPHHRTRHYNGISNFMEGSDEKFIEWLIDETPIHYPDDDVFGHRRHAQRIASLLLKKRPSNIAVLGPYGSGKSSVINLINYYLTNISRLPPQFHSGNFSGEIVTCKINGWGRISGTVAQKILALSIEEVKKHVDCLAIVTLPENYRQAIAGSNSPLGAVIAALLNNSNDPVAQLVKLDNILAAAELRLVIILEDLDRNVGDEIMKEELPALLDRLRALHQVSFLLAIGTERQLSDILIRVCDVQEAVA